MESSHIISWKNVAVACKSAYDNFRAGKEHTKNK